MPTRRPARKPVRRTRNPSSAITPTLIARIKQMTHDNDHTGAILALAVALKMERAVKALRGVEAIADYYGHMPHDLSVVRFDISKKVLASAKRETDAATYQRLYMAF